MKLILYSRTINSLEIINELIKLYVTCLTFGLMIVRFIKDVHRKC